ncbi:MAG TPA: IscS subfamily cysteine desulfurase [Bacteroidetes bacterium]|nr:IscS subfamily cysteine desulfurase [Bacteroidota bacterium]
MTLKIPIYLDNHSTTKVDPKVVEAMLPYFSENYGNAASRQHEFGWKAEAAVENARKQIARLVGAENPEIVFTSGGTESINLALKGVAEAYASKRNHIITATTEHKAVLDTCARLEEHGFEITYLPVDTAGLISVADLKNAITNKTILVTIMLANNEIGTIAPIAEIGAVCRGAGIFFHADATQATGKIPVNVVEMNVDLMSFSAHKMYGPKGVGALYVRANRPKVNLTALIDGGGHERGMRSGTLNVPAIVGFGKAAALAQENMSMEAKRVAAFRDELESGITSQFDEVMVNGNQAHRLPNNSNMTFKGVNADRLILDMKDIAVSSGSACSSASPEPSHVLRAIGLGDEDVLSSIRFGLGRFTTAEEIDYTINRVVQTMKAAREKSLQLAHP